MSQGDQIDGGKVHGTISLLTSELQKYQNPQCDLDFSDSETVNSDQLKYIQKYKSKLSIKNQLIEQLKRDLTTACSVARTVADAKEKQNVTLNNKLLLIKKDNLELAQKLKNQLHVVTKLSEKNIKLHNTIDCLANMIQLGFKELQKLRCELPETPSVVEQLKSTILCCGQYYINYCNEKETSTKLRSKNRFLAKKIYILENNLDSVTEQLKYQQFLNMRHRKVDINNSEKPSLYKAIVSYSGLKIKQTASSSMKTSIDEEAHGERKVLKELEKKLDLTSHLSIVKKLLNDQDSLSEDLKIISQDFCAS